MPDKATINFGLCPNPQSILAPWFRIDPRFFLGRAIRVAVRFDGRLFYRRLVGPFIGMPEGIFGRRRGAVRMFVGVLLVAAVHGIILAKRSACGFLVCH
jgi:hypothetical protein